RRPRAFDHGLNVSTRAAEPRRGGRLLRPESGWALLGLLFRPGSALESFRIYVRPDWADVRGGRAPRARTATRPCRDDRLGRGGRADHPDLPHPGRDAPARYPDRGRTGRPAHGGDLRGPRFGVCARAIAPIRPFSGGLAPGQSDSERHPVPNCPRDVLRRRERVLDLRSWHIRPIADRTGERCEHLGQRHAPLSRALRRAGSRERPGVPRVRDRVRDQRIDLRRGSVLVAAHGDPGWPCSRNGLELLYRARPDDDPRGPAPAHRGPSSEPAGVTGGTAWE